MKLTHVHSGSASRRGRALRLSALSFAMLGVSSFVSTSAQAQDGFALGRFSPSEAGSQWFSSDSLDLRSSRAFSVRLLGDYAFKPLVAYDSVTGDESTSIVKHQVLGHLGVSSTFFDRLRIGVNLPVALYATGSEATINGTTYAPPEKYALGDVRLTADVRLFGEYGDAFTAAVGGRVFFPTGSEDAYTGSGKFAFAGHALFAGQAGYFAYAGRLGYNFRDSATVGTTEVGADIDASLAAGVKLLDGALFIGPEAIAATRASGDYLFTKLGSPLEVLLGSHYDITPSWRIGLGGGMGLTRGIGTPVARGLLSVEWTPDMTPEDTDGDGIADKDDACPTVRGVASADPKKHGCPDKDGDGILDGDDACVDVKGLASTDAAKNGCPDSDGDGIVDALDACPTVAGIATSDAKTNGCPDKDGDGIVDAQDACVDVKGIATSDAKTNGCPDKDGDGITDAQDACVDVKGITTSDAKTNGCPDTDGDGIVDSADNCPKEAGPASTEAGKNGCPRPADTDGDGIPNEKDACPAVAGPASKDPKQNGCPDTDSDAVRDNVDACPKEPGQETQDPKTNGCPVGAVIDGKIVLDAIQFETNKDVIKQVSDETLNKVLATINRLPATNRYRIEGHTDSKGNKKANQDLSQRRAAAVVKWFSAKGIAADRFEAKGFGQDRPIADNKTAEGRTKNRRVEIHIIDGGTDKLPAQPVPAAPAAPAAPKAAEPATKK